MDSKLELVLIPVSDVDVAKDFYTQAASFALEIDGSACDGARIVQIPHEGQPVPSASAPGWASAPGRS